MTTCIFKIKFSFKESLINVFKTLVRKIRKKKKNP